MRILIALLLTGLLALASAHAQFNSFPPGTFTGKAARDAGGVVFSGPGDAVAGADTFWSCSRGFNAAYANGTNPLCDLKAVTGGATVCTLRVATTGLADLAASYCAGTTPAAACAAASGGSCVVSKIYDQAGTSCAGATACHMVQATLASMPALTFSSLNGLPCTTWVATNSMASATALTQASPYTHMMVAKRTGGVTSFTGVLEGASQSILFGYNNSANNALLYNGGNTVTFGATDNVFHSIIGVYNNTTSSIQVSGSLSGTLNLGTAAAWSATTPAMAGAGTLGANFIGVMCELGIWSGAMSTGNQTTLYGNQNGTNGYNGGV